MKNKTTFNFFDWITDGLDRFELSYVTFLTKILPIIIPIPTAIQTRVHVTQHLGYTPTQGLIVAAIVEFFGYASLYKALQFAEHNRKYTAEKNQAPFKFAIVIYGFYLAVVITFNVLPELATDKPSYIIAMNILMALLSIPGGALAGISAIHTERKEALKKPRTEQANERPNEQPNEQANEYRTNEQPNERTRQPKNRRPAPRTNVPLPQANEQVTPFGFPTDKPAGERIADYIAHIRATEDRTPGQSEIARNVGVSKSTADAVLKKMQ